MLTEQNFMRTGSKGEGTGKGTGKCLGKGDQRITLERGGKSCLQHSSADALKAGRPPPLCQSDCMLSSPTSASGLHADILLPKLPVRQLV